MSAKYRCTLCPRTFVHKETLKEHHFLHQSVLLSGNRFSCPVCHCNVTCDFGVHSHGDTKFSSATAIDEHAENNVSWTNNVIDSKHSLSSASDADDGLNDTSEFSSPVAGLKVKLKSRRQSKSGEVHAANFADVAGAVSCNICNKTFVYQKCLQKHMTSVHGLLPGVNSKADAAAVCGLDRDSEQRSKEQHSSLSAEQWHNNHLASDENDLKMNLDAGNISLRSHKSAMSKRSSLSSLSKSDKLRSVRAHLTCKACSKTFRYKTTLDRHWRIVHGGTETDSCKCAVCNLTFDDQLAFSEHFESKHPKQASKIRRLIAGRQTRSVASNGILRQGNNLGVAWCEKCNRWFTSRRTFLKHCSVEHRSLTSTPLSDTAHRCSYCKESFATKDALVFHQQNKHSVHEGDKSLASSVISSERLNTSSVSAVKIERDKNESSSDETIAESDAENATEDLNAKTRKYFCSVCSKSFTSEAYLERHTRVKHKQLSEESADYKVRLDCKPRQQTFVCGNCSEEFTTESALAMHVEHVHGTQTVDNTECVCPLCGCLCPNQSMFSMHYDAVHHADQVQHPLLPAVSLEMQQHAMPRCRSCLLWFTNEQMLDAHRCPKQPSPRHPPKPGRARYRCMICGEVFEILRHFLQHRKEKHRVAGPDAQSSSQQSADGDETKDIMQNGSDSAAFYPRGRPRKLMSTDMQSAASEVQKQKRLLMQKRFRMPRGYSRDLPADGASLSCPECKLTFSSVSLLRKHRKSEHRNRTCQLCGETCKSADMVYYHNLKHHHVQKCEVCGASCSGRLGLIEHFRTEHPTEQPPLINRKTLICEYCPRVFASCASRLLRDHIESCHLGRVHLCDVCGKRLGSAQTLAVHRRMHDPVARFECRECNRRFPHNTNLMNHIRKHHPERLPAKYVRDFRCEVCSMQFGSSSGLSRHRNEKHGNTRQQCDQCLRVFQSVTGLRVHKRRDHPSKDDIADAASLIAGDAPVASISQPEAPLSLPLPLPHAPPAPVLAQFAVDSSNAIMAGFMANMINLPNLGQTLQ